ncbi:hypothetical protein CONLIGDRAFT_681345 [Coniochaeta ligniaria NRRL 30616]|uniref:Uncharacterized protein n=1 Tax=Coniochaeta ligniaria NRRL 30616 TaxID=1408157 RepID=A0A1J7J513_9PEZI|nr:hypothetical protein CONLIGDRAFT_681345 [Coniochaeta ligniaria NRRL 30616]
MPPANLRSLDGMSAPEQAQSSTTSNVGAEIEHDAEIQLLCNITLEARNIQAFVRQSVQQTLTQWDSALKNYITTTRESLDLAKIQNFDTVAAQLLLTDLTAMLWNLRLFILGATDVFVSGKDNEVVNFVQAMQTLGTLAGFETEFDVLAEQMCKMDINLEDDMGDE